MKEINRHGQMQYVTQFPEKFSASQKYPLLIYIHGAGGRGGEIEELYNDNFFDVAKEQNLNVVSVAPKCYEDNWFSIFEQLHEFLLHMIHQDYIDKSRVYVMGASMGGYTTWQLAMSWPELFAAIVPICGGGMYWNAGRLKDMGVWAFHGSEDPVVFCEESKKMVDAVNAAGGNAKLTVYEGVEHASWVNTFQNQEMWTWLLEQKKDLV